MTSQVSGLEYHRKCIEERETKFLRQSLWFARKSRLNIYRVYLNLVNSRRDVKRT